MRPSPTHEPRGAPPGPPAASPPDGPARGASPEPPRWVFLGGAFARRSAWPPPRRGALGRWLYPLAVLAVLVAGWELGVRLLELPRYILPSPGLVAWTLWSKAPVFAAHTAVTLQEVMGGGLLGIAVGVGLGLLMFFFTPLEKALYPLLVASQNVPVFAIAPLLVVWFGYGYLPKVLMAAIIVFFPITVSALDGLKRTDPDLVRLFRTMGATPAQILWKLRVPAALPPLFSGLRISVIYSTIGAVIGEWVGAGAGLGYLMLSANAQLRVAEVFGAIVCLTPIGLVLLGLVSLAERWLMPWQRIDRQAGDGASL